MSSALTVSSLTKAYAERPILRGVSFHLAAGERAALLGPSGSGKTTLLNCIGGVDRADIGEVIVAGEKLHALDADGLARVRRTRIGTVFQFFHLLPTLTAAENVELPLHLLGVGAVERENRVRNLLERVGVSHRAAALPSELSGGEMQRVAIARAVIHKPALLLADEHGRTGSRIVSGDRA
jgi:ABC-type lipoprotein export system ATPase subunit